MPFANCRHSVGHALFRYRDQCEPEKRNGQYEEAPRRGHHAGPERRTGKSGEYAFGGKPQ